MSCKQKFLSIQHIENLSISGIDFFLSGIDKNNFIYIAYGTFVYI